MISPLLLIGIVLVVVLAFSLGKILSHVFRFVYYAMIAAVILVFLFGISWNELMGMMQQLLLLVF